MKATRSLRLLAKSRAHRGWLEVGGVLLAAAILSAVTWFGTLTAVAVIQHETKARLEGDVANQALLFESQLSRELLVVDQSLRIIEQQWEAAPADFDLQAWCRRVLVLDAVPLHVFIADAGGVIRASTRPELMGLDVSGRDYFRHEAEIRRDEGAMFISPSTRGLVTEHWQLNMARRLDGPEDRFLGVVALSYDVGSLTRLYHEADLGQDGMIAVIGARDGRIRALAGASHAEPGSDVSDSAMVRALRGEGSGRWTGPSAPDGVRRVHAFRLIPGRDLAVVVAFDEASAVRASAPLVLGARVFAVGLTVFIFVMAAILLRALWAGRRREARLRRHRATLAVANAELDAARRRAAAKAAQLEATLAGMSDGLSMVDADLRLVAWNALFAAATGVPPELLQVGTPMEELVRAQARGGEFGPIDIDAEVERRMALLRSGQAIGTVERRRPGGRTLELRRRALPGGGFVTLYTDVTARKQAEEALRHAREVAEAATAAKGRFMAMVSHEIRTPLNTLLSSLGLLEDVRLSPPERYLIEMARRAGDSLLGLIDDVLEMSSMEARRLSLRPTSFPLRPFLEASLELWRRQAEARGQRVVLTVAADVPERLHGDAGRIRQILTNLLSNAVKFAGAGPITLLAELRPHAENMAMRLTVRDPGPALSPADCSRIFQPFSRLQRPQAEFTSGSGLGLTICQGLASLMEGEVGCSRSPEGGNDFWLLLPIDAEKAPPSSSRWGHPTPRARILLVEDVPANQLVTSTLLRRDGHMVDVANCGEEALRALARSVYDIVLMDVSMPGMSGLEATRRLRELPPPAGVVPVIALTGSIAPGERAQCYEAGMQDLMLKPIEISRMAEMIARYVGLAGAVPAVAVGAKGERRVELPSRISEERVAELRSNLPPSAVLRLARDGLAELRKRATDLDAVLRAGDADLIGRQAHAMAGLAASYGLDALLGQLRAVMEAAGAGDLMRARRNGGGLRLELDRAAPDLLAALGEAAIAG